MILQTINSSTKSTCRKAQAQRPTRVGKNCFTFALLALTLLLASPSGAKAAPPDLTAAGAIAALKAGTLANAYPGYGETYNLGATGLRGWIYLSGGWGTTYGSDGTMTAESRQILVTVASTPGSAVLAVDDVILGVMAGSTGTVPSFTGDCRKAFGVAIGDAEKTGAGTLRVKRWRAGTTTDVNIAMTIMGNYTATAPYTCPKSTLILANARTKLVAQLLANPNFFTTGHGYARAISGLALLAGVAPGDANYATVQTRLQTYARALAASSPPATFKFSTLDTWSTAYITLFLSEYYLSTNDAQVVTGLNNYIVALSKSQSRYGTYGHGGSLLKADGSLHGTIPPYGPVNMAGIPANLAIVVGKKALVAAGQAIDPEIDPAIQRGSDFFAWFVNKGGIPYGEHEPNFNNHGSNGKDPLCAVLFGLQANRAVETEFFARMSVSGCTGREYGHTGQGFSYLWGAMGANMGGSLAVAEFLKPVRWHLDLSRRTDGSFAYDGAEQYGGGSTAGGTYLGACGYNDMNPTASYILTYGLPLKRLYITGKNANPANTLDAAKVANAVAAATYKQDRTGFTTTQLIAALSEFDPVVRNYAAIELGIRSLSSGELTTLRNMVSGTNANGRMGACETLGRLKDVTALPLITQRLDKTIETNSWVRAKAASALRRYPAASLSTKLTPMLTAFVANATDPEVIVWDDPLQFANGYVSYALFGGGLEAATSVPSYTINASKNLLYPAVKVGLKQPDSLPRAGAAQFCYDYLTLPDVQALALDIFEVITKKCQANTMWNIDPQLKGIALLRKHNCAEGLPMALSMMDVKPGWGWNAFGNLSTVLDNLATWGDSARWIIPFLNEDISTLQTNLNIVDYTPLVPKIQSTIATIDNAITSPGPINYLLPLATAQVVTTTGAKAITLTGTSPRSAVTFTNVTAPAHGTLTGTAPNLTYTRNSGYTGPDHFTFRVNDVLTTSDPGTVSIIVGSAGTGLKGEYYDNANFTNLKLTRTDAQVNFDWATGSPNAALGADTFSVRWSGLLLVPKTGSYMFSTLNSDGVRLYINGVPVIDQFAIQEINWNDSAPINLTEGQMLEIQMDYYENAGSAVAKLKWTGPSFAGVNGAIIGSQWLFDGTGMPRTSYAYAQSLKLLKNTSKAITLTASAGSLTYSVLTPPAHGNLSGAAPNLTYTPVANYIGPDSFTFKVNNGTSDSAPATVSINVLPVNTFSVNFYVGPSWPYGGLTTDEQKANVLVPAGVPAGFGDWFTYGWLNVEVPWGGGQQPLQVLTSTHGSTATFNFKDCRNGWTYNGPRTTLLGDGNGNMMDGHVNSTLLADGGPNLFDMEVTNIPFDVYDVIFYIGANQAQFGDGTGVIKFNGGADRAFTLKPGAFNGTFTEMVNATTQGNYIVFSGVTGSSFTTKTWGTGAGGFNHIGPFGFQIREVPDTMPPTLVGSSIVDDRGGAPVEQNTLVNYTVTFSEGMDAGTVSAADFGNAGTSAVTIGTVTETSPGVFTVPVTPTSVGTLRLRVNAGAVLNDAAGNALVTTAAITDDTTITVTLPVNTFSVNFYVGPSWPYGGLTTDEQKANVLVPAGVPAGFGEWYKSGWLNVEVPWGGGQQPLQVLTSTHGSTATFNFKDCRNGWTYNGARTTLLGDGNGNMMDGHVNSTLDPGDGSNLFDMEVTGIPFAVYDVIFYIGATLNQFGDGTGVIKFNGGADRAFKLKPGAFDGTFTEMVDATTQGNYIVFKGVTGSSFTTQTWGNGFNHVGPFGFQIREAAVADTTPPTLNGSSIVDDKGGSPVTVGTLVTYTVTFSEDMDASTVSAADFGNAGTSAVTIGTVTETSPGVFTVPVTPTSAGTLRLRVNAGAVLNDAAGNALVTTADITDDTTLTVTPLNTAPTITTYSPADNATGVAVFANLVATFSENVTIGTGNITLKNLSDGTQTTIVVTDTTQVSISGAVLTINPTADLLSGKNYAVQIAATAIRDLANNAFAGIANDTAWNFTTLTDFAVWAAKFAGANLTDPNADFDGDRQSNDYERIWGLNPTNAASQNPFTSTSNLAVGNFSYTRRIPSLTGYSYTVWTSTNLTTWAQDTGAVQAPGAPVAEVETVTVNLSPALLGGPRLFVRMRAAQP